MHVSFLGMFFDACAWMCGWRVGTDPEEVIHNAFGCFDASGSGAIDEEQ